MRLEVVKKANRHLAINNKAKEKKEAKNCNQCFFLIHYSDNWIFFKTSMCMFTGFKLWHEANKKCVENTKLLFRWVLSGERESIIWVYTALDNRHKSLYVN